MIQWKTILHLTSKGNLEPNHRVEKSDSEWQEILTPEQYRITRQKEQNAHILERFVAVSIKESTAVFVAIPLYLMRL